MSLHAKHNTAQDGQGRERSRGGSSSSSSSDATGSSGGTAALKRSSKGSSSKSNTSSKGGNASSSSGKGGNASSSSSGKGGNATSSSGKGGNASSSSSSKGSSSPRSFADLLLPPDHELVAEVLGTEQAVLWFAHMEDAGIIHSTSSSGGNQTASSGIAMCALLILLSVFGQLKASLADEETGELRPTPAAAATAVAGRGGAAGLGGWLGSGADRARALCMLGFTAQHLFLSLPVLQLLLEAVALLGEEQLLSNEQLLCLRFLAEAIELTTAANRRAFLDARGPLLLQVLWRVAREQDAAAAVVANTPKTVVKGKREGYTVEYIYGLINSCAFAWVEDEGECRQLVCEL